MGIVIGLCGPSGSGKTTLAKMLANEFKANVISLDNYFLLDPPYKKYVDNGKNWELPENVDWDAINKVVKSIHSGDETLKVRKIDWDSNTYSENELEVSSMTIVEGFLLLHDDTLVEKMDLSVYIDVPDQVGLERRMKRDGTNNYREWYEEVTFPEYASRRGAFKQKADLVLNGEDELELNLEVLVASIQKVQN